MLSNRCVRAAFKYSSVHDGKRLAIGEATPHAVHESSPMRTCGRAESCVMVSRLDDWGLHSVI